MPEVLNILNSRKINIKNSAKLSFKVGEVFSAKITDSSANDTTITIKMLDGWKFDAELLDKRNVLPQGLVRFKVEGSDNGKLALTLLNEEVPSKGETGTMEVEDAETLKSILKHGIPLTKENVADVKALLNLKTQLLNEEFQESCIKNYLKFKNIEEIDSLADSVTKDIKELFDQIKNLTEEDILLLKQNGIDLSSDNIKSYVNLFSKDMTLFKELTSGKAIDKQILIAGELRNSIIEELKSKGDLMKHVIEAALNSGSIDLNNSLNDIKVFNTISNSFYYMDVPLNLLNNDYQCKLIIKDDRKSGKKIDSQNVKLVLSVNTVNLGIVDAYVDVRERNLNIKITCDEENIKKLQGGIKHLLNNLLEMNYSADINVSKRVNKAVLSETNSFFEEDIPLSIDVKA